MRVIIIGHGSIGRRHERICKIVDPECEVIIVTRNHTVQSNLESYVTNNIDKGVALKPDCAIIASPSSFHVRHTLKMIESGCDCLVEKPLSNNLKGVLSLCSKAEEMGCIVQVGYNLRYDPCLIQAKNIIESQLYGPLLSVRCEFGQYLPDWRPNQDYRESVSGKRSLGGGILLEMSHEIDYLSWIVGPTNWVSAWIEKAGKLEINVEDTALLRLGLQHMEREIVANVSIDFIRRDKIRRCYFICEDGTIKWDGTKSTLSVESNNSRLLKLGSNDSNYTYIEQFRDFLECIKQRRKPKNGLVSGFKTLEIIEASRLSSHRSGIKCYTR